MNDIVAGLGDRTSSVLLNTTNDVYELVDGSVGSLFEYAKKFRGAMQEIFPDHTIIGFLSAEQQMENQEEGGGAP